MCCVCVSLIVTPVNMIFFNTTHRHKINVYKEVHKGNEDIIKTTGNRKKKQTDAIVSQPCKFFL